MDHERVAQAPGHTSPSRDDAHTPWTAEIGAKRGAWIKTATGEWAALACGDTDESAAKYARLIVRAVNSHADMLAALKETREFVATHPTIPDGAGWYQNKTITEIDAAIAKAEGR